MDKVLEFIKGPYRNKWIEYRGMKVYLRKQSCVHPLTKEYIHCLGIANVQVAQSGNGRFKQWLADMIDLIKSRVEFDAIMVENVLTPRFADFFDRLQWIKTSHSVPSFFLVLRGKDACTDTVSPLDCIVQ